MTLSNGAQAGVRCASVLALSMLSTPDLSHAAEHASPCTTEGEWCTLAASYDYYATSYGTADRAFVVTTQNVAAIPCSNDLGDPAGGSLKTCHYIEMRPKPDETFVDCAVEGGICNVEVPEGAYRVARYGTPQGNHWLYNNLASSTACSNSGFGYNIDPAGGVVKVCQVSTQMVRPIVTQADEARWFPCGQEGQDCAPASGTGTYLIRFGEGNDWLYRTVVGTGTHCASTSFGFDPAAGRVKHCYFLPVPTVLKVTGTWERVSACSKCDAGTYEFSWGVEKGNTRDNTSSWAQEVKVTVETGFAVKGVDVSSTVESTTSFGESNSVTDSYTQKAEGKALYSCPSDLGALWQFQTTVDEFCRPNSPSCSTTAKAKLFRCAAVSEKPSAAWTSEF